MTLGKGPSAASSVVWHVPVSRDIHFTGREKALAELRERLAKSDSRSRVQIVTGDAGVGKTRMVAEFAHRSRELYAIVWWVNADNIATTRAGLMQLADLLNLSLARNTSTGKVLNSLFAHLQTRKDWLLIFDNAPSAASLHGLLPTNVSGQIIITSRDTNWTNIGGVFPIGRFDRRESITLLQRWHTQSEKVESADRLARALDDIPLAIDQAAVYLSRLNLSFDQYLAIFEAHWGELLGAHRPKTDEAVSIVISWDLAYQKVRLLHPTSAQVLAICVFFSSQRIPISLLRRAAPFAPEELGMVLNEPVSCVDAVSHLVEFGLVEMTGQSLRVHPSCAKLARQKMDEPEQRTWATLAARTMASAFGFDPMQSESWTETAQMLPHAIDAASYAEQAGVAKDAIRSIYNQAGLYMLETADYDAAHDLLNRAMQITLEIYGYDNPRVSPIANNLGRLLIRFGDYSAAAEQFERALELDQRRYGPGHPHVAEVINNRGICRHAMGDSVMSEADFKWAMDIYVQIYGSEHGKIAAILNNLGHLCAKRGDMPEAREKLTSALKMAQTTLGQAHPDVASVLRNIGEVDLASGQLHSAQVCYEHALDIDESALGAHHPDTASDHAGLGETLARLGNSANAKHHLLRSIAIEESRSRVNMRRLVERYELLLGIHRNLGESDEAVKCAAVVNDLKYSLDQSRKAG